jgi:O-antigen/teichoic acid export membrane protein
MFGYTLVSMQAVYRILKWSEKYIKTDMTYLAKGGFWMVLKYLTGIIAGLVTTVAFANLVDPTTYGTYQFVISVGSVLGILTLSGMGLAINRAVAQGRDGAFRYGVRTKLRWSIGITLAAGLLAAYYFLNGNTVLGASILLAGALQPIILSFREYENYLGGKLLFKEDSLIEVIRKVFPFLLLLSVLFYSNNVIVLIATYYLSNALSYLAGYWFVIWKHRPSYKNDDEALHFSKHLSGMTAIATIGAQADKVLLWYFIGPVAVATFTIAQFATRYAGGILETVTTIALPKFAVRDLKTLQETLPRKVLIFTGLMMFVTVCYILFAPFVFDILFPNYPDAVLLTQVLALSLLFLPRNLYYKALVAHTQTRSLYYATTIVPVSKISLLLILLPIYGIWGAVYALLASEFLAAIVYFSLFMKEKNNI